MYTKISTYGFIVTTVFLYLSLATLNAKENTVNQTNFGKLPLSFEANTGQTDTEVKYFSHGSGYQLFLTPTETILALKKSDPSPPNTTTTGSIQITKPVDLQYTALRMRLIGANSNPKVVGLEKLPGKTNYFHGKDPKKWHTNVTTYAKVEYENIYPNINLVYYGNQQQLEYDFVLAPGADPNNIRLTFDGIEQLRLSEHGDLELQTSGGTLIQHKPKVYQEIEGKLHPVDSRYVVERNNEVVFQLASYRPDKPVIIDPVLVYSTYLGGSDWDAGSGITVDTEGNIYLTGRTESVDFKTIDGLQPTPNGGADAFVVKFNPNGDTLQYATYLGGSNADEGNDIQVDATGSVYVVGHTFASLDFPLVNPVQPTYGGGPIDGFIVKINPSGDTLMYSTYLGGNGLDMASGIALDGNNRAHVTGLTQSTNFPTANPLQPTLSGMQDGFVTKLNKTGNALVYSTYLGGTDSDRSFDIDVGTNGNAYVVGDTWSPEFPIRNAFQPIFGGVSDGFVAKLNPTGEKFIYSTFLGGNSGGTDLEGARAVAVDSAGKAYVTGTTNSANFPTHNALQPNFAGGRSDAFVSVFHTDGTALSYSTYFGGSRDVSGNGDKGTGIGLDKKGNILFAGTTGSINLPVVNAIQSQLTGGVNQDAFVAKLSPSGNRLKYSTYLGGSKHETNSGFATDAAGNIYITGQTVSEDLPTTVDAFQRTIAGGLSDAYLAKVSPLNSVARIIADAKIVARQPNKNFGTKNNLIADADPMHEFLIKFEISRVGSAQIKRAILSLYCANGSFKGGDFYGVSNNKWSEHSVTWNTAPPADLGLIDSMGEVKKGQWVDIDVSSLINGEGKYSLRVSSQAKNGVSYRSKDAKNFAPQLFLTLK